MTSHDFRQRHRSPLNRFFRALTLGVVIVVLLGHAIGGWVVSSWIHDAALAPADLEVTQDGAVIRVDDNRLTLVAFESADDDVRAPGLLGFALESGAYLRLGEIVEMSGTEVVRTFELVDGVTPEVGVSGAVDRNATPVDTILSEMGLETISYESPLGPMDAWLVKGSDTWVIHIHDRSANLDQALRMMTVLQPVGVTQLSINYRNDPDQPQDPGGVASYGVTERNDLAAAVEYARASGAEEVFFAGYGSGAAIAVAQIYRDSDIIGAILDGPVLGSESSIRFQAEQREDGLISALPSTVTSVALVLASLRYGVSWDTSNYLARADQLTIPTLLLHGTEDAVYPIQNSRTLAEDRPELVTLVEFEGAGNDLTWNLDPAAYEAAVLTFIDRARSGP